MMKYKFVRDGFEITNCDLDYFGEDDNALLVISLINKDTTTKLWCKRYEYELIEWYVYLNEKNLVLESGTNIQDIRFHLRLSLNWLIEQKQTEEIKTIIEYVQRLLRC